jgi:hypothetical protein
MAALVLSIAGAAAGSAVLGPVGAIVGRLVGEAAIAPWWRTFRDVRHMSALPPKADIHR